MPRFSLPSSTFLLFHRTVESNSLIYYVYCLPTVCPQEYKLYDVCFIYWCIQVPETVQFILSVQEIFVEWKLYFSDLSIFHIFFKGSFFVVCFVIYLFFYFWLHWVSVAAPGLFSSWGERGLLFAAVHWLLIAVASLVVECWL